MAISDAINDTSLHLKSYRGLGSTYRSAGKTRISINYLERILDYEKTYKDQEFIASTMSSIQSHYKDLAEYEKALNYGFKSLHLREKIGSQCRIDSSLLDIANIYRHLDEYENAELYAEEAEKIYTSINCSLDRVHNQRGLINLSKGNNLEAIKFFQLAYVKLESDRDLDGMGRELGNIGIAYRRLEDYEKYLEYQLAAFKLKREVNSIMYMSNSYSSISRIYFYMKDYAQSKLYLDTALQLSTELELNNRILGHYWSYSDLYEEMGDHKRALKYYTLYLKLKDSIYSEQNQEKIAEMSTLYELNKVENENGLLRKDNEIQSLQLVYKDEARFLYIVIICFSLMMVVIDYL